MNQTNKRFHRRATQIMAAGAAITLMIAAGVVAEPIAFFLTMGAFLLGVLFTVMSFALNEMRITTTEEPEKEKKRVPDGSLYGRNEGQPYP